MVENSTTLYEQTCSDDLKETSIGEIDTVFEAKIKLNIQRLAKEPSNTILENILAYSKSFAGK